VFLTHQQQQLIAAMVELSAMDTGESPAEVEAKIERMFKGQPKVQGRPDCYLTDAWMRRRHMHARHAIACRQIRASDAFRAPSRDAAMLCRAFPLTTSTCTM
jgi:hypothetical protein